MHHVLFFVQVGSGEDRVFWDVEWGPLDLCVEQLDHLHLLEGHPGPRLQFTGWDAAWINLVN